MCSLRIPPPCAPDPQRFKKQRGGRRFVAAGRGSGGASGEAPDSRFDKALTDRRFALGRATGDSTSSSSSDSSDSDSSDSELEEVEGVLGRAKEAVPTGEESRRLAVMNCDWDHFSAVDILFVLQVRVCVYGEWGACPDTRVGCAHVWLCECARV
jgi:hypothetical protein